jgi:hypothetical protein
VLWEFNGLKTLDANTSKIAFGIYKSGTGAGAYVEFTGDAAIIHYKKGVGVAQDVVVNVPPLNGTGANSARNIGLLILPKYGQIYIMEDDQVLCHVGAASTDTVPMIVAENCQPDFAITANSSTNAAVRIQQVKLTLYSY